MFVSYISTKIGIIKIIATMNEIVFVGITNEIENDTNNNELTVKCESELFEYLNGERNHFDLPFKIYATEFEQKVLNCVLKIPYGKTISYKELAQMVGKPNGYQAVAKALSKNNILFLVPCHRVILKNGKLGGYKGGELAKQFLINLEKNNAQKLN